MHKAEFDKFADEYYILHQKNIRLSGESTEFFAEYKIKDVFELFMHRKHKQNPLQILDFGAGIGTSTPHFRRFFPDASLTCLDVSEKSLEVGRSRFSDLANFQSFDGTHIPYPDNTFDLVFAACVFHHIPYSAHFGLLREWLRTIKPGGTAIIFEHNPLNPLTVNAVNTCPFDENAQLIRGKQLRKEMQRAGFQNVGLHYRLFVPGTLRALRPLERWLQWCPLGAQYFVHAIKQ
ncbi:class I SAM-dependent methyltransferase [Methylobacter sp.]|uniref:class I SAM-dependent methyltransferase n=1 Tax=Methylobacter sp. TaxID=2051955 RepID=UPI002FDD899C